MIKEGTIEVITKIKGYLITQIDIENFEGRYTLFKGKSVGLQRYVIPISTGGDNSTNLIIDFSGKGSNIA